ncbi:MAG: UvrD-helicase domain-containing protein [Coriobacteriia bacterium]|nr:UvrD-helicase domain-containing protein [Coriobacteriia bacterium]
MAVSFTPQQETCVNTLVGPVDISAGAGSGKTFTLTQRIAHALEDPTSGVDSVDQVLAITFTEKAAAELKGRVRSTLRAKGLFDEALKVDGAWISTIHGMCARILRAQALDLGIDPAFKVIDGADDAQLFAEALDAALLEGGEDGRYAQLTSEYPIASRERGASVTGLVQQVLDASLGMAEGPQGLRRAAGPGGAGAGGACSPVKLASQLQQAYEDVRAALEATKPGTQRDEALEHIQQACEALDAFQQQEDQSFAALLGALDSCKLVRKFAAKDLKPVCEDYLAVHYQVIRTAVAGCSGVLLEQLLTLAASTQAHYNQRKREEAALTNNDLLVQASRALSVPRIAEAYVNKFRLVMVDEFQDTDQLQLGMVEKLAGPGMRYLCTVGDAQQSIYGFRGADIAVYRRYQQRLDQLDVVQAGGVPCKLQLNTNFRSHQDVLAFVRTVCQQPQVFGSSFLDLDANYDGAKYQATQPRIQLFASVACAGKGAGSSVNDARAVQAAQIADYFASMAREGHSLADMVLLLGASTHSEEYAQAIREKVGPCVVTGGSLFATAPEVAVAGALLRAIANPLDTESLFQALSSEAFALDAGDFLNLATGERDGAVARRKLDVGLAVLGKCIVAGDQPACSPALAHAVTVMAKTQQALRVLPPHAVLMDALKDSGWLQRLEAAGAEGLSRVGNLLKAVRLVESLEEAGTVGFATVVSRFGETLARLKEAPGALNAGGQQAVRIMTIHASKGLEFPIVALADFDSAPRTSSFVMHKVEGVPFVSLLASPGELAGQLQVNRAMGDCQPLDDPTVGALECAPADVVHVTLQQMAKTAEQEERQRLFYVAATRAKEALGVFFAFKQNKNGISAGEGLADDVQQALFAGDGFPLDSCEVDFGGTQPAAYTVAFTGADAGDADQNPAAVSEGAQPEQVSLPCVQPFAQLPVTAPAPDPTGLFSYSSLAHAAEGVANNVIPSTAAEGGEVEESTPGPTRPQPAATLSVSLAAYDAVDEPDILEGPPDRTNAFDADKATDFGSALHRLAQIAALQGPETAREKLPDLRSVYGVRDGARLQQALECWLDSDECAYAFSFQRHQPEVPFSIQAANGVLEGEIDLLCTTPGQTNALVIDYKTGGRPEETQEMLEAKHGLQARCYAYAVLNQGYEQVELIFFRVEQNNTVTFRFTKEDLPTLYQAIRSAAPA